LFGCFASAAVPAKAMSAASETIVMAKILISGPSSVDL
jgi:hypothetical protein